MFMAGGKDKLPFVLGRGNRELWVKRLKQLGPIARDRTGSLPPRVPRAPRC